MKSHQMKIPENTVLWVDKVEVEKLRTCRVKGLLVLMPAAKALGLSEVARGVFVNQGEDIANPNH